MLDLREQLAKACGETGDPILAGWLEGLALLVARGHLGTSQLTQEAFVLGLRGTEPGFFLEVGGGSPDVNSNTHILETEFGWGGLVVEPHPEFAERHRVRRQSGRVQVVEAALGLVARSGTLVLDGELSSLQDTHASGGHAVSRADALARGSAVTVQVRTATEVLRHASAPKHLDFLSLDVEGAEVEVLQSFPWDTHTVGLACVEHNHRPDELDIDAILEAQGMARVLRGLTGFDGWYVNARLYGPPIINGDRE